MAVLVEAKDDKRSGTAFFPSERPGKQRISVEVIDRPWLKRNWDRLKAQIESKENARVKSLVRLKDALNGKSSDLERATSEVIRTSEPFQNLMSALSEAVRAGEFKPIWRADGGPVVKGPFWKPSSPNPLETASEFMFSISENPRAVAAAELTLGFSRLRPCVWLDKHEQRQFGLFCTDTLAAIYAVMGLGFGIAACLRCGGLFLRTRVDKQFCSPRCQNTYLTAKRRHARSTKARKRSKSRPV